MTEDRGAIRDTVTLRSVPGTCWGAPVLKIEHRIFVPGNHSTAIEQGMIRAKEHPTIRFLIHQQTQLGDLVVFGTPYTPKFFDWAFMRQRKDLDAVWQTVPDRVDILISHGPPKGILDTTRDRARARFVDGSIFRSQFMKQQHPRLGKAETRVF